MRTVMFGRVASLLRSEITKYARLKVPYVGLLASALMAFVAHLNMQIMETPGETSFASYMVVSMNISTTVIIPIFSMIFAAALVAGEAQRGTLRTILVRPVTRADFLTAKLITALGYLALLFAANLVPALIIGMQYPLSTEFDAQAAIPGPAGMAGIFALGIVLAYIPQAAGATFGLLISVLSRNSTTAMGLAVGILLTLEPLKAFLRHGDFAMEKFVFSGHFDTAMNIVISKASGMYATWGDARIVTLLGVSAVTAAVCLGVAYAVFTRRDLND